MCRRQAGDATWMNGAPTGLRILEVAQQAHEAYKPHPDILSWETQSGIQAGRGQARSTGTLQVADEHM